MRALDLVIAELASRQHGVLTVAQLTAAGASRNAIAHRVANGRLTAVHRGVYRLGETHTRLTSLMAATLAAGPTGALSHHAAAELHGIAKPRPGPIDVTVTRGHARQRDGLRIHRARTTETTRVHGIPTTTVAQTIKDLAAVLSGRDLQRAVEEAQVHRKLDMPTLARAVDEARGRRGVRALRATTDHGPRFTRSEAERRLLELVRSAGLPEPETNVRVAGYEVDALWRDHGVVVEVDGQAFHSTREAMERDRRKDADLEAAGYAVKRVTWTQITRQREAVVARLARALSAGPASGRPLAAAAPRGSPPGPRRW